DAAAKHPSPPASLAAAKVYCPPHKASTPPMIKMAPTVDVMAPMKFSTARVPSYSFALRPSEARLLIRPTSPGEGIRGPTPWLQGWREGCPRGDARWSGQRWHCQGWPRETRAGGEAGWPDPRPRPRTKTTGCVGWCRVPLLRANLPQPESGLQGAGGVLF